MKNYVLALAVFLILVGAVSADCKDFSYKQYYQFTVDYGSYSPECDQCYKSEELVDAITLSKVND